MSELLVVFPRLGGLYFSVSVVYYVFKYIILWYIIYIFIIIFIFCI